NMTFNPVGTTDLNTPSAHAACTVKISGINITPAAGGTSIKLDASYAGGFTQTLNFISATTLTNGATGLNVNGNHGAITGSTLANVTFSGQSGDYIKLTNSGLT